MRILLGAKDCLTNQIKFGREGVMNSKLILNSREYVFALRNSEGDAGRYFGQLKKPLKLNSNKM
jgi:hypothetical protein